MPDQKPAGRPAQPPPQHSIGVATDAFNLPFHGGLLVFRAGQRVVAHPELRAAIELHHLPVRFHVPGEGRGEES
jgi:hypothetical protein